MYHPPRQQSKVVREELLGRILGHTVPGNENAVKPPCAGSKLNASKLESMLRVTGGDERWYSVSISLSTGYRPLGVQGQRRGYVLCVNLLTLSHHHSFASDRPQTTGLWNGVLYAREWALSHDPLRFFPRFQDRMIVSCCPRQEGVRLGLLPLVKRGGVGFVLALVCEFWLRCFVFVRSFVTRLCVFVPLRLCFGVSVGSLWLRCFVSLRFCVGLCEFTLAQVLRL